jgi:hypothetical protein
MESLFGGRLLFVRGTLVYAGYAQTTQISHPAFAFTERLP